MMATSSGLPLNRQAQVPLRQTLIDCLRLPFPCRHKGTAYQFSRSPLPKVEHPAILFIHLRIICEVDLQFTKSAVPVCADQIEQGFFRATPGQEYRPMSSMPPPVPL
jgi:hypothetical protein